MSGYKRVSILLRDTEDSQLHNERILEYLNDRHQQLNDVKFAVAIDIVDNDNINKFIKKGITSIPALIVDNDIQYGVNSILATLAKLEIMNNTLPNDPFTDRIDGDDPEQAFRDRALKEMMSDEQDDIDSKSSVRAKGQDFAETPISEKDISEKMSQMDSYYAERKKRNNPMSKKSKFTPGKPPVVPSAKQNVEKLIAEKGYDKGEAAFMREIARNLE